MFIWTQVYYFRDYIEETIIEMFVFRPYKLLKMILQAIKMKMPLLYHKNVLQKNKTKHDMNIRLVTITNQYLPIIKKKRDAMLQLPYLK
jgi:hypothetical protein